MSQTYTIVAIVGFSLAALLILIALIMFFTLHIKQVRDDLTGKTATRSIAEIRARAKTRKRTTTQAAKRYGWEKEALSTGDLKAAAAGRNDRAVTSTGPTEEEGRKHKEDPVITLVAEAAYDDDESDTTMLSEKNLLEEDEPYTTYFERKDEEDSTTTFLSEKTNAEEAEGTSDEEEGQTTILTNDSDKPTNEDDDEEVLTTMLGNAPQKKTNKKATGLMSILLVAMTLIGGSFLVQEAYADELTEHLEIKDLEALTAQPLEALEESSVLEDAVIQDTVVIGFNKATIVVPYGVEVETWLNQQIDFYNLDYSSVCSYFENSQPLKLASPLSLYPNEGATISVAWNNLTSAAIASGVITENIASVTFIMGEVITYFPAEVGIYKAGSAASYGDLGIGDKRRFWLNDPWNNTYTIKTKSVPSSTFAKKEATSLSLAANGTFASPLTNVTLTKKLEVYPQQYYYKVKNHTLLSLDESLRIDPTITEETRISLEAGQIIALPTLCFDKTAPTVKALTWNETEGAGNTFESGVYKTHQTRKLMLDIKVADSSPAPEPGDPAPVTGEEKSDIEKVIVTYNGYSSGELSEISKGVYRCDLGELVGSAVSSVTNIRINVYDKAGNSYTLNLGSLTDEQKADFLPGYDRFIIDDSVPIVTMESTGGQGVITSGDPINSNASITLSIRDAGFADLIRQMDKHGVDDWNAILTIYCNGTEEAALAFEDFSPGSDADTVEAHYQTLGEGTYTFLLDFRNTFRTQCSASNSAAINTFTFMVDTSAPRLLSAIWSADAESTMANKILFAREAAFTLEAADEKRDLVTDAFINDSGIAAVSLVYTDSTGVTKTVSDIQADAFGLYTVTFSEDAEISYTDIYIVLTDGAGNTTGIGGQGEALSDFYQTLPAAERPDYNKTIITNTAPEAGFVYNTENLKNANYLKVSGQAWVYIYDPYFASAQAAYVRMSVDDRAKVTPILEVKHTINGTDSSTRSLTYKAFQEVEPGVWATDLQEYSEEGHYELELNYKGLTGYSFTLKETINNKQAFSQTMFWVDKTKPEFGKATINPAKPTEWNWIFSPQEAQLKIEVSDALSGIDPQELAIKVNGSNQETVYNDSTKVLSCSFPADDRRIRFSQVKLEIEDMAGNKSTVDNFQTYEQKNIDEKTEGIMTDSAAPVLEVSYDNNNPENDYYYKAGRTATVTISEASFDFVIDNDPRRVIVTKTVNDSDRSIYAEDFKNPSGDGLTWVVEVPCTTDGDYVLRAAFTDPSGKASTPFEDTFVVDTADPMIMVSFDNNESESGGYFKATRTATVTIYEDNFSQDMASLSTHASDASGAAVSAPGATGWQQVKKGEWETTVYFGDELHYSMQVNCTDLAGNVGEQAEEPEFVIDMTAPIVAIEGVENQTAYAEAISPRVSFEDTNFEPYLTNITFVGAAQGEEGFYFDNTEKLTDTSRIVSYTDFEYELSIDDVYTMTATIKDMAGNEAEQIVTFSVNRFGSNYRFDRGTRSAIGSYLKSPQDIVIVETNVSGLESSSIRMAQNDQVSTLSEDEHYRIEVTGSQESWSQYTYTLPAKLFTEDAYYRVMLASHDLAGNYSENLMKGKNADRDDAFEVNFAVDGTDPTASLKNAEEGTAYYGPSQQIDIFISDNLEADSARLMVNKAIVREWNAEELAADRAFTYDLTAADNAQNLQVEIRDKAGNISTYDLSDITVTRDWWRYVLSTPAILYPSIAGVILVIGLVGIIAGRVIGKRQKEKKTAAYIR